MRTLLLMVALVGCAAEADGPAGPIVIDRVELPDMMGAADAPEVDVCALAAALPDDDICSLICDPAAMADRLLADGSDRGACYQLYCALTQAEHVLVGVCLPP